MSMAGRRPMMTTSPYGSSLCRMVAVAVAELGRKNDVTHPSTFQNGRLLTNSIATTANGKTNARDSVRKAPVKEVFMCSST